MPSKSNTTKIKAVPVNTTVIDFEDDEPSQNETQDVLQVIENIRTEQQQPVEQEVHAAQVKIAGQKSSAYKMMNKVKQAE